MSSIGEKLEEFYLSLNHSPCDLGYISDCLFAIETHPPAPQPKSSTLATAVTGSAVGAVATQGESEKVIQEIVKHCHKKAAQVLRTFFAEGVRALIAAIRKRLAAKASLSLDSDSSQQHSQRHLNAIIELLGYWSNVVDQCVEQDFSQELVKAALAPLYTRTAEAAFDCFQALRRDKELDQWGMKLLDPEVECNLISLDFLITQVSTMREILHQHYSFLFQSCSSLRTTYTASVPAAITSVAHASSTDVSITSGSNNTNTEVVGTDIAVSRRAGTAVSIGDVGGGLADGTMLLVSQDEIMQWRELEAIYTTLEFGFVTRSVGEAFSELGLLEIEPTVHIPQCIEDVFFLLNKVTERALSTGSESCIFSVGNKVLEALRYSGDEADGYCAMYRMVCSKAVFRDCTRQACVDYQVMNHLLHGAPLTGVGLVGQQRVGVGIGLGWGSSSSGSGSGSVPTTPVAPRGISARTNNTPAIGSSSGWAGGGGGAGESSVAVGLETPAPSSGKRGSVGGIGGIAAATRDDPSATPAGNERGSNSNTNSYSNNNSNGSNAANGYSTPPPSRAAPGAGPGARPGATGAPTAPASLSWEDNTLTGSIAKSIAQSALSQYLLGAAAGDGGAAHVAPSATCATGGSNTNDTNNGNGNGIGFGSSGGKGGRGAALVDVAAVSITGVNHWLADQLSPYMAAEDSAATANVTAGADHGASSNGDAMGGRAKSAGLPPSGSSSNSSYSNTISSNIGGATHMRTPPSSAQHKYALRQQQIQQSRMQMRQAQSGSSSAVASGSAMNSPASGGMPHSPSLDQLLLNALESDAGDYSQSQSHQQGGLRGEDWIVQINSLTTVVSSLRHLRSAYESSKSIVEIYQTASQTAGVTSSSSSNCSGRGISKSKSSILDILTQELSLCEKQYQELLESEAKTFAETVFSEDIKAGMQHFSASKFDISGQAMEDRSNDRILHRLLYSCLGHLLPPERRSRYRSNSRMHPSSSSCSSTAPYSAGGTRGDGECNGAADFNGNNASNSGKASSTHAPCSGGSTGTGLPPSASYSRGGRGPRGYMVSANAVSNFSHAAYVVFLQELGKILCRELLERLIYTNSFTEWGALLLHDEIVWMGRFLEHLVDNHEPSHIASVKASLKPLHFATKILTLDAPGDIRRYRIPRNLGGSILDETAVRKILSRRNEFSKDAVLKVKLNFV